MKVDFETLKSQCLKVVLQSVAAPDSADMAEQANMLAGQFECFSGKFWYVWVNPGDGVFNASVLTSEELSDLASQGKQIELKSGPLDSLEEAKQFMDTTIASDSQRSAKVKAFKPPRKGKVEWGRGGDGMIDERPDVAISVVDVYWGEQGNPKHTQRFHLGVSPGKLLWVLWQEYVNASGNSPPPWVIAHMAKKGVTPKVAAKKLLTYALEEERDESMKRFDDVLSPGCLSMAEVEEIASNVWKEE